VAPPSPTQLAWRGRVESVLRIAAPALDLVLAAGDRISRLADRDGLGAPPAPQRVEPPSPMRRVGAGAGAAARPEDGTE
jgi:hypothetical protein